ncbi:MAG: acylphosphatase [Ginsengibacter sp.]
MQTLHLIISGKVQGVFFRAKAKVEAEKYGITGWIKNTQDKKVEALITGEPAMLDIFVSWCRRGPEKAKVDEVIVSEHAANSFNAFEILR